MDLVGMITDLTGAGHVDELTGGHQSRVFAVRWGARRQPLAVKVLDADLVDQGAVEARTVVAERLAAVEPLVCGPRRLGGRLVTTVEVGPRSVLVTAWEWAVGRPLDPGSPEDSALMGRTLATVHASMREVDAAALPPDAALRAVPVDPALDDQLLHGDVNHGNLCLGADGQVRVFDLDDCGRGPALFDVANAVYMARFSTWRDGRGASFEEPFIAGYADGTGGPVDADVLEQLVEVRIAALRTWLDDLTSAPIGIRRADAAWRDVLRRFADGER